MDWDGDLWVDEDSKTKSPKVQNEIKSAIEDIMEIDIEKLRFVLEMVKNLDFDIAGGNFIRLNGSIVRDGVIHYPLQRKYQEKIHYYSQPLSTHPIEMDEVFLKTDWGFSYCCVIDVNQFLFKQGGYFWLWDNGVLYGWKKKPDLQLTFILNPLAAPEHYYKNMSFIDAGLNASDFASVGWSSTSVMFTQGFSAKAFEEIVMSLPLFNQAVNKKYGKELKKVLEQNIESIEKERYKRTQTSWYTGKPYQPLSAEGKKQEDAQFIRREYDKYHDYFIEGRLQQNEESKYQGETLVEAIDEYSVTTDVTVVLRKGNLELRENTNKILNYRYEPLDTEHDWGHDKLFAWSQTIRDSFRDNSKPVVVSNWRDDGVIFDKGLLSFKKYNEDEDKWKHTPIYPISSIPNFNMELFQYKLSHGILNRMVL